MTTLREYWLIPALVFGMVGIILVIYAGLGGNPLNRIGYALFVSVVPAVIVLAVTQFKRLLRFVAYFSYLGLFFLVVILQGVIRQWQ